ncbi:hypothetical protein BJX61DRAFT_370098 [Aspergillus egyptiacus]|nr:hypothetical protein BJX61DRAFT_370098 [Aspergillus egyptiacus]
MALNSGLRHLARQMSNWMAFMLTTSTYLVSCIECAGFLAFGAAIPETSAAAAVISRNLYQNPGRGRCLPKVGTQQIAGRRICMPSNILHILSSTIPRGSIKAKATNFTLRRGLLLQNLHSELLLSHTVPFFFKAPSPLRTSTAYLLQFPFEQLQCSIHNISLHCVRESASREPYSKGWGSSLSRQEPWRIPMMDGRERKI